MLLGWSRAKVDGYRLGSDALKVLFRDVLVDERVLKVEPGKKGGSRM